MPPLVLSLVLSLVQQSPELIAELETLFKAGTPTPQDWANLRGRVLLKSYASYDPGLTAVAAFVPTKAPATAAAAQASAAVPPVQQQKDQAADPLEKAPAQQAAAPVELTIHDTHTE